MTCERGIHELYADDPERADYLVFGRKWYADRRGFLQKAGLATMGTILGATIPFARHMPGGVIPAALAATPDEFILKGKQGLVVRNDRPINLETPAHLLNPEITPVEHFFVRNNGLVPEATKTSDTWELTIDGEVDKPIKITLGELRKDFEHVTMQAVIECAGNGRAAFEPSPRGNQWEVGAVGNGEFTGVRLRDVLKRVGVRSSAVYTGHYGADPHLSLDPNRQSLSRGIPIAKAQHPDTLLIWGMNGRDLPLAHGFPLRILVPGWIGSASQKWLTRIWIRDKEHDGPGMTGLSYRVPRYPVEPGAKVRNEDMEVMTTLRVKSLITSPQTNTEAAAAKLLRIRGHAWSGESEVAKVQVSTDYGIRWIDTTMKSPPNKYAWATFETDVRFPQAGYYEIWARATDAGGESQPMILPGWNPRGYGNNRAHRIAIKAV
jgi:DMSO/TMAO reductase YedYZ molybdopterin-dependent catalytic subunit